MEPDEEGSLTFHESASTFPFGQQKFFSEDDLAGDGGEEKVKV